MQDEMNDLQMPYTDPAPGDLVRVCRCADCKYFDNRPGWQSCLAFGKWFGEIEMSSNDYCSYGERKDGR